MLAILITRMSASSGRPGKKETTGRCNTVLASPVPTSQIMMSSWATTKFQVGAEKMRRDDRVLGSHSRFLFCSLLQQGQDNLAAFEIMLCLWIIAGSRSQELQHALHACDCFQGIVTENYFQGIVLILKGLSPWSFHHEALRKQLVAHSGTLWLVTSLPKIRLEDNVENSM